MVCIHLGISLWWILFNSTTVEELILRRSWARRQVDLEQNIGEGPPLRGETKGQCQEATRKKPPDVEEVIRRETLKPKENVLYIKSMAWATRSIPLGSVEVFGKNSLVCWFVGLGFVLFCFLAWQCWWEREGLGTGNSGIRCHHVICKLLNGIIHISSLRKTPVRTLSRSYTPSLMHT